MPVSSPAKVVTLGLPIHPWLGDGTQHTPTLPDLADWIVEYVTGCPILDAGCGSGELLRLLIERGVKESLLYGCDIEPGHAELASRRTGLKTIKCASLCDGNPFPDVEFATVAAINWLQSDWPAEYSFCIPKAEKNPERMPQIIAAVKDCIRGGGFFVWDCHSPSHGEGFIHTLLHNGCWTLQEVLVFPPDDKRYPENYPIWIFHRLYSDVGVRIKSKNHVIF